MASFYSVVRFVPSALAEEFVNVGVVAFGDGHVCGKFLEDWSRVERFAGGNLEGARAFQEWVEESSAPDAPSYLRVKPISEEIVRRLAKEWTGSVQLTDPRASLLEPDELLEDVAQAVLVEPPTGPARVADKRRVASAATHSLKQAIQALALKDSHLAVRTRRPIGAAVRQRTFDIVISNGTPRYAVQCFDFNVADTKKLLEQVDATAFAIEDVRKKFAGFPVSVVAAPPPSPRDSTTYEQAQKTFAEVEVELVTEQALDAWSHRVAKSLTP